MPGLVAANIAAIDVASTIVIFFNTDFPPSTDTSLLLVRPPRSGCGPPNLNAAARARSFRLPWPASSASALVLPALPGNAPSGLDRRSILRRSPRQNSAQNAPGSARDDRA